MGKGIRQVFQNNMNLSSFPFILKDSLLEVPELPAELTDIEFTRRDSRAQVLKILPVYFILKNLDLMYL